MHDLLSLEHYDPNHGIPGKTNQKLLLRTDTKINNLLINLKIAQKNTCRIRSTTSHFSKQYTIISQLQLAQIFLFIERMRPPVQRGLLLQFIFMDVTKSLRFFIKGSPCSFVGGFFCFGGFWEGFFWGLEICLVFCIGGINNEEYYYLVIIIWVYLKYYKNMEGKSVFPYDPKWESVEFKAPEKKIITFADVEVFQKGKTHAEYLRFLAQLQEAVQCKPISATGKIEKFAIFQPYFHQLHQFLKEIPPIQQPMRYGNKAFKDWHLKACALTEQFIQKILPEKIKGAKAELCRYINQSWGSNVRIDYGTGHEMSFMFFCWSLYRLGFCGDNQLEYLVRQLFYQYIRLMRAVQLQYMLEPAGSHGVWGLDDYHFLPFLLGAAEIIGNGDLQSPQCISNDNLVQKYANEYMYLNCIQFIKIAKKGVPFHESSPILHNVSGAASWQKIAGGMPKMYKVEVLGKHPVIKHQYFGTIIPYQ